MKKLNIVIPCYNEEEVLPETAKRVLALIQKMIQQNKISDESRILFVDDGSKDKTWQMIEELHLTDAHFSGLKLSCNKGHQNALMAGLMYSKDHSDFAISMDADLQDDIGVAETMVDYFNKGVDVIYGVRSARKNDTFFKRNTALMFYRFMSFLGVNIVYNHADYRCLSQRALVALSEFKEVNLFLRGIVPLIGFEHKVVEYERSDRFAGESKYPLKKMLNFALDGITSFSVKPIRFITALGAIIFSGSMLITVYFIIIHFLGVTVAGWTTIVVSIWALGGIQLLSLGIIGEYIGKIYLESKARPKYFLDVVLDSE